MKPVGVCCNRIPAILREEHLLAKLMLGMQLLNNCVDNLA
jgi:hypothetical protein